VCVCECVFVHFLPELVSLCVGGFCVCLLVCLCVRICVFVVCEDCVHIIHINNISHFEMELAGFYMFVIRASICVCTQPRCICLDKHARSWPTFTHMHNMHACMHTYNAYT
jgi:hypothetical protein